MSSATVGPDPPRGLAPGLVTGGPGRSGGAPQEDRRREILLRVLMFFAGLGDFAVLWLLKFRLWAVVAVVIGLLVIDEVLKRLVKGTGQRDRSTDG
jgi:hypothetical protein